MSNRNELLEQLEKLHSLKEKGILNDDEFIKQKELILKNLESVSTVDKTQERKEGVFSNPQENGNEIKRFLNLYRKQIIKGISIVGILSFIPSIIGLFELLNALNSPYFKMVEVGLSFSYEQVIWVIIIGLLIVVWSYVEMFKMKKLGLFLYLFSAISIFIYGLFIFGLTFLNSDFIGKFSWVNIVSYVTWWAYFYYWKYFSPMKKNIGLEQFSTSMSKPVFDLKEPTEKNEQKNQQTVWEKLNETQNQEQSQNKQTPVETPTTSSITKKPKEVNTKRVVLIICLIVFIPMITFLGWKYFFDGNKNVANTDKETITHAINTWNNFHNNYSKVDSLKFLYADSVLLYGTTMTNEESISAIKNWMNTNAGFHQDIIGEVKFDTIDNEKIKCGFLKRGTIRNATFDYSAYLIFKKFNDNWKIIEESDLTTDANLKRITINNNDNLNSSSHLDYDSRFTYLIGRFEGTLGEYKNVTFTITNIEENTIKGFDLINGIVRDFTGTINKITESNEDSPLTFNIYLKEPGDKEGDGEYSLTFFNFPNPELSGVGITFNKKYEADLKLFKMTQNEISNQTNYFPRTMTVKNKNVKVYFNPDYTPSKGSRNIYQGKKVNVTHEENNFYYVTYFENGSTIGGFILKTDLE